jgi:hypothetical protein
LSDLLIMHFSSFQQLFEALSLLLSCAKVVVHVFVVSFLNELAGVALAHAHFPRYFVQGRCNAQCRKHHDPMFWGHERKVQILFLADHHSKDACGRDNVSLHLGNHSAKLRNICRHEIPLSNSSRRK